MVMPKAAAHSSLLSFDVDPMILVGAHHLALNPR